MIEEAQKKIKPSYTKLVITFWVIFTLGFGTVYYIFNGIANLVYKSPTAIKIINT